LKAPLSLAAAALIGLIALFGRLDPEQAQLLWIIGLSQIAVTVSYLGHAVFRATRRLEVEALSSFVRGALYLGASVGALLFGFPLSSAAWAILIANGSSMAITLALACSIIRPALPRRLAQEARRLLAQSLPLAGSVIAMSIFSALSVIGLRLLMDDRSVGWYNSAHSLTSHMSFIPEVVMAALLPPMVVALERDAADRQPLTEMVLILLGLSLPIALGATLLAPHIMSLVFGAKFAPAAATLTWLIWTVPFTFVNVAYLMFLNVGKQQYVWPAFVLLGIAISILSLLALVPIFGSVGAALARLAGEIGVFLLGTWKVRKALDSARLLAGTARIGLALAGLLAVVWVSQSAPVVIPIGLGAAIYGILIATCGPWPIRDWHAVVSR
jgi:O-antigen/teichoic acid export membrane protein